MKSYLFLIENYVLIGFLKIIGVKQLLFTFGKPLIYNMILKLRMIPPQTQILLFYSKLLHIKSKAKVIQK